MQSLEQIINKLLMETTKYDFPMFASATKKQRIITERKEHVEQTLQSAASEFFPAEEVRDEIWKQALQHTEEEFSMVAEKHKLSGFYLQELMHFYAEEIGKYILTSKGDKHRE